MNQQEQSRLQHIAIIMDGNGRWAEQRHLPRIVGHEAGVKSIEKILKYVVEKEIQVLTLFAFGIENWGRPTEEINFLMDLFLNNLQSQSEQFLKNNIQFRVIGDSTRIHSELLNKIQQVQALTAANTGLILVIAFSYSGQWDILQATQTLCKKVACGELSADEIGYPHLQQALCLADLPEPDLFIRTSGEQRISNFLLWQLAYTELYFTEVLWPDFDEMELEKALREFSLRQRRYGLIRQQVEEKT
jgi:undecaprenyl diphosphate synthase